MPSPVRDKSLFLTFLVRRGDRQNESGADRRSCESVVTLVVVQVNIALRPGVCSCGS